MTPHTPWESRTVRAAALTNCRKVSLLVSVVCDLQGHVHEASPMLRSHKVYNVKGVMSLWIPLLAHVQVDKKNLVTYL